MAEEGQYVSEVGRTIAQEENCEKKIQRGIYL